MRILLICSESINKQGGTAIRLKEITSSWIKRGHEVIVLAPQYGGLDPEGWTATLLLVRFPGRNIFYYLFFELLSFVLVPISILKKRHDIVMSTGGLMSWPLSKLVGLLDRPYIVELNGIADIEATRTLKAGIFSKLAGWAIEYSGIYKSADLYICVATGIRNEIIKRYPSQKGKCVTIGNGIDPSRFFIRNRSECRGILGIDQSLFIFGFVGMLCPWHGTEDLITATKILKLRGHKDFRTMIVGTGERYSALRSLVALEQVEDIISFAGRISPERVPIYMGCFNVACQVHNDPIIGRLGDSMKFWEYLASGLPIIVSDMSDSSRFIQPGKVGWKFRGGDPVELADRMEFAMQKRAELSRFEIINRDIAINGHRWDDIAEGIIAEIAKVLGRFRA
jgi:glycosyltransferase involved in cell wall biosynthesis